MISVIGSTNKSKKIYEDDTWLERCALVCWLIILLPIVVVCYIISKGLLIMDSINDLRGK